jgi:Zn-dependent protease with chaperone function
MSTDFFTSQDDARRQTGRLVALFTLGVMGTMLSLWLVAVVALAIGGSGRNGGGPDWAGAFSNWQALLAVIVSVGGVVGIVTLFKLGQMSQSGAAIAEILGGTRIAPSTRDPGERQLLNIVEEMSIASGVPVPPVYVLEDASINAFAAGPDPSNSAIGVTRGCMELLSRDEMQGVIAHEYSHIFHGDTRINARTTAVIAGIMAVGLIGYLCFRFVGPALARSRGGKNNPGPAIGAALIVIGLAVWAIGSIGMLFGRLIQAAISRQREFLADAAAVQYTRNPNGIACALAKIRDHSARVSSPKASELNHFFFASTLHTLFATHPPIERRIAALKAMGALGVPERARSASADEANRKFGQRSARRTRALQVSRVSRVSRTSQAWVVKARVVKAWVVQCRAARRPRRPRASTPKSRAPEPSTKPASARSPRGARRSRPRSSTRRAIPSARAPSATRSRAVPMATRAATRWSQAATARPTTPTRGLRRRSRASPATRSSRSSISRRRRSSTSAPSATAASARRLRARCVPTASSTSASGPS